MFLNKMKIVVIVLFALGLVGTGVGSLAHKSKADSPSSSTPSAREDKGRADPLAQEKPKAEAPAPARVKPPAPQPPVEHSPHAWQAMLNHEVDYPGLEDPRATLTDVLDQLSKRYNLVFHIDENAFRVIDPEIQIFRFRICSTPVPEMHASLKTVLQTILYRLPSKAAPMLLYRKDYIEITTGTAVRAELHIPAARRFLPLVSYRSTYETTLDGVLHQLRQQSGYNIVVNPRLADKLETPITIEFSNVPVDTAVRLLASMTGMSVVRLDNLLYVTTAENAKQLREEQAMINAETPAKESEAPKNSAAEKNAN
jgi:hypothetical protein